MLSIFNFLLLSKSKKKELQNVLNNIAFHAKIAICAILLFCSNICVNIAFANIYVCIFILFLKQDI